MQQSCNSVTVYNFIETFTITGHYQILLKYITTENGSPVTTVNQHE